MDDALVDLVGESEGDFRPFDEWRLAAIQAGLQPAKIQNLKRRGLVWTRLNAEGVNEIVRGQRPAPEPVE